MRRACTYAYSACGRVRGRIGRLGMRPAVARVIAAAVGFCGAMALSASTDDWPWREAVGAMDYLPVSMYWVLCYCFAMFVASLKRRFVASLGRDQARNDPTLYGPSDDQ